MIHNYKEFCDDINELGKYFIEEFSFFYTASNDSIKLENTKMTIIFEINEVGALYITISNKMKNKFYDLFWLNIFFGYHNNEIIFNKYSSFLEKEEKLMGELRSSIRFDMRYKFDFLAKYYCTILKGDFSWEENFDKWIYWVNNNWRPKSDDETPPSYVDYLK
jgi:hypothetical protein